MITVAELGNLISKRLKEADIYGKLTSNEIEIVWGDLCLLNVKVCQNDWGMIFNWIFTDKMVPAIHGESFKSWLEFSSSDTSYMVLSEDNGQKDYAQKVYDVSDVAVSDDGDRTIVIEMIENSRAYYLDK